MAYKNKKKNKAHLKTLENTGWRADNKKKAAEKKFRNQINSFGINDEETIKRIMRKQGLI